jgi:hypothetical protein
MDLQGKATHAIALAKWKVNHEVLLNGLRSKLQATEGNIVREKYRLAELTFELYKQNKISDEFLLKVCGGIQELYDISTQQKKEIESAKAEMPPQYGVVSVPISNNDLVCPKCGGGVPVRFCPNCGTEGVSISASPSSSTTNTNN